MVHQKPQKSSWNPPSRGKCSQATPLPFTVQLQQDSHSSPTREEAENDAFNQTKFEALGLQLKEKHGSITPLERNRLGMLQGKMNVFWERRAPTEPHFAANLAAVPPRSCATPDSAAVQSKGAFHAYGINATLEPKQGRIVSAPATCAVPLQATNAPGRNQTGMPDTLKAGLEQLSGLDMSGVRVHYNSVKPGQIDALAYTQGQDIEVGPGQKRHLPHEGWHVVQQMQGRVKPTRQLTGGALVNDGFGLEQEADVMGGRAAQMARENTAKSTTDTFAAEPVQRNDTAGITVRGGNNGTYQSERQFNANPLLGIIQAVWGNVGNAEGERVNLRNLGDGTFRHKATGRTFTRDEHNPNIFHPIPDPMDEAVDEDRPEGPLRSAFRAARETVEARIGRQLEEQEWDVVADHAAEAINGMREVGIDPVAALSGPDGASCIPTSDRLYALLRGDNETSADAEADTAQRLTALAQSIENEGRNSVYQVVFGPSDHGFVVTVVDGMAEVTQSFAASESLGRNLESANFTFTRAAVAGHLRNFLDDGATGGAQGALFEGRIDDDGDRPIAAMQLRWNRSDLRDNAAAAVQDEVTRRANTLLPQGD